MIYTYLNAINVKNVPDLYDVFLQEDEDEPLTKKTVDLNRLENELFGGENKIIDHEYLCIALEYLFFNIISENTKTKNKALFGILRNELILRIKNNKEYKAVIEDTAFDMDRCFKYGCNQRDLAVSFIRLLKLIKNEMTTRPISDLINTPKTNMILLISLLLINSDIKKKMDDLALKQCTRMVTLNVDNLWYASIFKITHVAAISHMKYSHKTSFINSMDKFIDKYSFDCDGDYMEVINITASTFILLTFYELISLYRLNTKLEQYLLLMRMVNLA